MTLLDLDAIKNEIESQAELGSRQGLSIEAFRGDETDLDNVDDSQLSDENDDEDKSNEGQESAEIEEVSDVLKSLENKFRTYYSRILFFAFLTSSSVNSLEDVIQSIDLEENTRIAKNLHLKKSILFLIKNHINIFILRQLDYKIQNINRLAHDEDVEPMKRAEIAIRKFGRISDSEVTTPRDVASDMIALIPNECFENLKNDADSHILDIASKMGEFAVAIVKHCNDLGIAVSDICSKVGSIPTSSIAYEFTRKVYEILGLDVNAIAETFTSYDCLSIKVVDENGTKSNVLDYNKICKILTQKKPLSKIMLTDECCDLLKENDKMIFNAIVGNPPYQEADGGASASSRPIYPFFVDIARKLEPSFISIIIPTRWYAGGKNLGEFRKSMLDDKHIRELHDFLHPEEIFPNTNNRGGVCYFLWDKDYNNMSSSKMKVVTHNGKDEITETYRSMKTRDLDIFIRNSRALSILDKVVPNDSVDVMSNHISPRRPFGLDGNFINTPAFHSSKEGMVEPIKCYGKARTIGYLEKADISSHKEWIDNWKVFMPYANNIGTELSDDNQNTFIGEPNTVCTETFLAVGQVDNLDRAKCSNLSNYLRTKFARFLLSLAKISQHGTSKTYRFVPVVDFSKKWTDQKLYAKFKLTKDEINLIETSIKPML